MYRIILDLNGTELTTEERELLQHPQVGGVILFSRNYSGSTQLQTLTKSIRAARRTDLLIAVDQEGGRVQRFREGFTTLPALGAIGKLYQTNPQQAHFVAETAGWLMAVELLVCGIDFSFAPVLDLNKGISQVIGDRAFHSDPKVVTELARSYLQGLQKAGMACVGKHFPGHGSVAADSHIVVPYDRRNYAVIEEEDLVPFKFLSKTLTGIMPAHVIYSEIDDKPAGFSSIWLQKILRDQLKFDGVIFSDDLSMAGAVFMGDIIDRAQLALEAGCDRLLICNDRANAIKAIEKLEHQKQKSTNMPAKLTKMQGHSIFEREQLLKLPQWQQAKNIINASFV